MYNGLGQRVYKTGGRYFVYDEQGQLIGEYDSAGKPFAETVYLDGMPVVVLKPATSSGSATPATDVHYVYADHLNTPRAITRASDNKIAWRWDNADPFGMLPPNENPSGLSGFEYNLRFPGQYFDKETNLHYNYFRDYDPGTGRYVQSDPIGLDGGINTYAYVEGNPIRDIDPMGLVKWTGNVLSGGASVLIAGYVREVYRLTSECKGGVQYRVSVVAESKLTNGGLAATPISYTGSSGNEFEDGLATPDPNVFNGTYFKWSAGIAGGPGISYGATQLGSAYSSASLQAQFGYEFAAGIAK